MYCTKLAGSLMNGLQLKEIFSIFWLTTEEVKKSNNIKKKEIQLLPMKQQAKRVKLSQKVKHRMVTIVCVAKELRKRPDFLKNQNQDGMTPPTLT